MRKSKSYWTTQRVVSEGKPVRDIARTFKMHEATIIAWLLREVLRSPHSAPNDSVMTPSPDKIRDEVGRIVSSPQFASSLRLSRFLRFIVDRTLAGQADQLKEFTI